MIGVLIKWRPALVMGWQQWRGTGATLGKVVHLSSFSIVRRPSDSGSMRERLDSIIVCGDMEDGNPPSSPDDSSSIEMTTLSASTSSTLAAIETSCVSSIVGDWAGKKLNATAVVSMAAQLIPQVEQLMTELKQLASTESTQQVVTSVLTTVLSLYSTQIDAFVTPAVAELLQEMLPSLIAHLFVIAQDVEKASCFSCLSTSATAKPTSVPAGIRPVHRLLATNATPPAAAVIVTVSSAPPTASPSSPAAHSVGAFGAAPVAAAGVPPIFFKP